jgi:hypothetical protein
LFLLVLLAAIGGTFAGLWEPGGPWFLVLFLSFVASVLFHKWGRWRRERIIREAPLPRFLQRKLRDTYSFLAQKDVELVERGLRQFFLACHRSERKFVAMPSRVVDTMWHEFILHTQAYRDWCRLAFGRFIDHTPAEVLGASPQHNDGLRRAWFWACKDEAIDPRAPTRLPLLFALDTKLRIDDGFHYEPDCGAPRRRARDDASPAVAVGAAGYVHCATSFADSSVAGDADGMGGSDSSSDSGGDGGCGGGGD